MLQIQLKAVYSELVTLEQTIGDAREKHNAFLVELGLRPLL